MRDRDSEFVGSSVGRHLFLLVLFLSLVMLASSVGLPGQCQRGVHPPGVTGVPGTSVGCQDIDGTGRLVWFSMFSVPSERGGPLTFSYVDPPSAGLRPQFAFGYTAVSTRVSVAGVPFGCNGGLFHVVPDILLPARIPLLPGCQVQSWTLPAFPGLQGISFYAQTWMVDLTVARDAVTGVIRFTVQP